MNISLNIQIHREAGTHDLPLPSYATSGSAGMDVRAAIEAQIILAPGERKLISTGIRLVLPEGYECQVRPRSGLALRHGLTLLNSPGTIDQDYTGVIKVILINLGQEFVTIERGDRIAQLVISPVIQVVWTEIETLQSKDAGMTASRGEGGFGSSGQ